MFDPQDTPRIFGLGLGIDFPSALVAGLQNRMKNRPPEDMARVQLIVNTARMRRRISTLFLNGDASFCHR